MRKSIQGSYNLEGIILAIDLPIMVMMNMEEKLKRFFEKNHQNINMAYLFGSYATNTITPLSDVDVAVLLNDGIDPKSYFDTQLDLSGELLSYLKKEAEVVILNRADPRLSYQIIKYGKVMFEKDPNLKADFERRVLNIYFDLVPMFDFYEKKLLERIKEGKFGKTYRGSRNSSTEIRRICEKLKTARKRYPG